MKTNILLCTHVGVGTVHPSKLPGAKCPETEGDQLIFVIRQQILAPSLENSSRAWQNTRRSIT